MTVSICLLYTVTLCFRGSYHQEICENTPRLQTHYTNVTLIPSYSIDTITCTYMLNNQPKSHLVDKSTNLSDQAFFTTLPINNTQSRNLQTTQGGNFNLSKTRTPLIQHNSPTSVHNNSPLPSLSTNLDHDQNKGKLVCSPQPTASNINANITTKNQSKSGRSEEDMPNVVKYVTVISLMAFAGGYSAGYGPGERLVN